MMKFKEIMFQNAKDSIHQAQSRYKKDYDHKRSSSEVVCTIKFKPTSVVFNVLLLPVRSWM